MTQPLALPSPLHEVRLDELGELIAGLPGLLGFPPIDSLVLATFTAGDGFQLGPTVRVDLPEPGDRLELVQQLGGALEQNQVAALVAVVVGGGRADPPTLPHRGLARLLAAVVADLGIRLVHSAWVPTVARDVTWWCYEDEECTGQVRDPETSALAVMQAVAGTVTYTSRGEMADLLAPDHEDRVAHRAQLLAALAELSPAAPAELQRELLAVVESTASSGSLPDLDDEQIVRLSTALDHEQVRDACLELSLTDRAGAAERLWTVLTRALPVPERSEPAFLLALCAYLRGAAILAGMALEVSVDAVPDHRMAPLLRDALDQATPPAHIRAMLTESVHRAHRVQRVRS